MRVIRRGVWVILAVVVILVAEATLHVHPLTFAMFYILLLPGFLVSRLPHVEGWGVLYTSLGFWMVALAVAAVFWGRRPSDFQ